jgi:hypothetical protein
MRRLTRKLPLEIGDATRLQGGRILSTLPSGPVALSRIPRSRNASVTLRACPAEGARISLTSSTPSRRPSPRPGSGSPLRPVVDLQTVIDVENVNNVAGPVDDAIGAAPGPVTTCQWPEQRLAGPVRVDRKGALTELQDRSGNALRKPLGDCSPCRWLEPDLVRRPGSCRHLPVARRRARSWRTVAMSPLSSNADVSAVP